MHMVKMVMFYRVQMWITPPVIQPFRALSRHATGNNDVRIFCQYRFFTDLGGTHWQPGKNILATTQFQYAGNKGIATLHYQVLMPDLIKNAYRPDLLITLLQGRQTLLKCLGGRHTLLRMAS